jgi:hypothetical protein
MAKDTEAPKSADKGKGNAVDNEVSKPKEVKKDKGGKPLANGKEEEVVLGGRTRMSSSFANY